MVSRSSITQNKPNSAVVTYSTLTVAAVGFFAYYLYHKLQNRRRRRDDDNNEENTQNVIINNMILHCYYYHHQREINSLLTALFAEFAVAGYYYLIAELGIKFFLFLYLSPSLL